MIVFRYQINFKVTTIMHALLKNFLILCKARKFKLQTQYFQYHVNHQELKLCEFVDRVKLLTFAIIKLNLSFLIRYCLILNKVWWSHSYYSSLKFIFLVCKEHFYDFDCNTPCGHCKDNVVCNNITGHCPNGCNNHWTGQKCDGNF